MKLTGAGEIVEATGDFSGDEGAKVAPIMRQMVLDARALVECSTATKDDDVNRLSVVHNDCVYSATAKDGSIYVVKNENWSAPN